MALTQRYINPLLVRIGLGCMLMLLVFAWHFYQERVAFLDLAFHTFAYFTSDELFIQNNRFAAAVTQIAPLLAIRAGVPMEGVLRLYSLAFPLYYLLVFLLSAYALRNARAAMLVPFLFTIIAAHTFYWAQSELPQGLALLVLYFAATSRHAPTPLAPRGLWPALLIPAVIYCHPLLVMPFVFVWGYDYLLHARWRDWPFYFFLALGLFSYWLRMHNIDPNSYEGQRLSFADNLINFYPNYFELTGSKEFFHLCTHRYIMLPIFLLSSIGFYLWQPGWPPKVRMLFVGMFALGYAMVINISYPDGTDAAYGENMFLPLALIVATPLAMELLPAVRPAWLAAALLVVLFIFRLSVIWNTHRPYTAYIDFLTRLTAYSKQFPERKFFVDEANANIHERRVSSWASTYETLLLTAQESPDSVRTVYIYNPDQEFAPDTKERNDLLLTPWAQLDQTILPERYFHLPSTVYRPLNTPAPADTAALRRYETALQGAKIELAEPLQDMRVRHTVFLPVRISNPTTQSIQSSLRTPAPTMLTYRFYSGKSWIIQDSYGNTPLEVDVTPAHTWMQAVRVVPPAEPGQYELEVWLASQNAPDAITRFRVPVTVQP